MLSFVRDLPNLCSLTGLFFALLSIYAVVTSQFNLAVAALLWAVFFDWADGIVARRLKGRTHIHSAYGAQLDSLIDIISFGVCPAVILMGYGGFSFFWFVPAFIILGAAAIRLSWFNVFGLSEDGSYSGLALDNNILIAAPLFLFSGSFDPRTFTWMLAVLFLLLSGLNLAPVKTSKFSSRWFPVLGVYCVMMTWALIF